jgi:hypothetical protein
VKSKILISIGLLWFTASCFAQQHNPVRELPAKGSLMQGSAAGEVSTGDDTTLKGLNAVMCVMQKINNNP